MKSAQVMKKTTPDAVMNSEGEYEDLTERWFSYDGASVTVPVELPDGHYQIEWDTYTGPVSTPRRTSGMLVAVGSARDSVDIDHNTYPGLEVILTGDRVDIIGND